MLQLTTPLSQIKNLPPRFANKLEKLGLETVRDLLWHFPARYEDFSQVYPIGDLEPNQQATVQGVVQFVDVKRTWKKRMFVTEANIQDTTGEIRAVWFNQPYIKNNVRVGSIFNFAGKVGYRDGELFLSNPTYEAVRGFETKHTGRLVPIYPETHGLTSKGLRYLVGQALQTIPPIPEFLPEHILKEFSFPDINQAIRTIHFPADIDEATAAKKRFAFEDLYLLQLYHVSQKQTLKKMRAPALAMAEAELAKLKDGLPFPLTAAQSRSVGEIIADLGKETPMNRLLQGDVGSGKTVVAALAALAAAKNGHSTAFLAPTEVLARQHFATLKKLLTPMTKETSVGLVTASGAKIFYESDLESDLKRPEFLKKLKAGEIKVAIGTHAILGNKMDFNNLGLVVIDEQHRFGVRQRAALLRRGEESGYSPHFLSMSATPIPRTLTLAMFGDLELSVIDEMPRGRKAIITKVVAPDNRAKAYAFIRGEVKKGRQAFVICPRIEQTPSEEGSIKSSAVQRKLFGSNWDDVKNVTEEYEKLTKKIFPDLKVAMLHGKMKPKEKETVMAAFKDKESDILVSTSVVEVGVDIPNATVMVIEDAERFGLAQLYQFRGRVGRGEHQSYCLLFASTSGVAAGERLAALISAKNGFELAEKDLEIRGPGEFLGESQAGLPDTAMRALKNISLVKDARKAAERTIAQSADLKKFPLLKKQLERLKEEVHME